MSPPDSRFTAAGATPTTRREAVQRDGPPDDSRIAAEAPLPETLADHRDRRPRLLLVVVETAARDGSDAEHVHQRGLMRAPTNCSGSPRRSA